MLWLGLVRLGYRDQGDHMAKVIEATLLREGLREYYDPYTGEGMAAVDFAWSALAMEMAKPDVDAASRSYL
jgi:hypothetical protein